MESYVQLNRTFSPVPKSQENENQDYQSYFLDNSDKKEWNDILKEFRCVILAEAGSGKTEEFKQQASFLYAQGLPSFFIRIEDIDSDFQDAFEIGSQEQFQQWLENYDEAWFFLDSVDEARLTNPNKFKKAINKFAARIAKAKHRAHIFISSRPYAWRPLEDQELIDDKLYLPTSNDNVQEQSDSDTNPDVNGSSLKVMMLRPLDSDSVRNYCSARAIENIDNLLNEISRLSLWSLAERPFDLESITSKWKENSALGSRIELFEHNIKVKLTEQHSADRADTQNLTLEKAQHGACRLAAAVILTGKAGILIPGSKANTKSIRANDVLSDWSSTDVRSLLELGIFNDIVYDTVRFRHREIRELLAAKWFDSLLKSGADRNSITSLFFREQYGEQIITPTLRSVLSWLILFDNEFFQKAVNIAPEIAVEGGDPAILPLPIREQLLENIVLKIALNDDDRGGRDNTAIARIAAPDLTPKAIILIRRFIDNDEAIFFLGRLVWQGKMINSLYLFESIVLSEKRGIYARIASLRALVTLGDKLYCSEIWAKLNVLQKEFDQQLLAELLEELPSNLTNTKHLLNSLKKLNFEKNGGDFYGVRQSLTKFINGITIKNDLEVCNCLLDGLSQLLNSEPFKDNRYCLISKSNAWLIGNTTQILEIIIKVKSELAFSPTAISTLISISHAREWGQRDYDDFKDNLHFLIPKWPQLNDALYWASVHKTRNSLEKNRGRLVDDWQVHCHGCFWSFDEKSYKRLLNTLPNLILEDDQLVAFSTAIRFYFLGNKLPTVLNDLKDAVKRNPILQGSLQLALGPRVRYKSEGEKDLDACVKKQEAKKSRNKQQRLEWIELLRIEPTRINNAPGTKTGKITNDIWWLFSEIKSEGLNQSRVRGANWHKLIPEFGEEIAKEYCEAVQSVWRYFDVELQSEHESFNNSYPEVLLVALAGLELESRQSPSFPHNLSHCELKQALRFLAKELNGFPSWLESLFKVFRAETTEAIKKELIWELDHTSTDNQLHYVLHDILYYAPWAHEAIAPAVFDWLIDNPKKILNFPKYCIQILIEANFSKEHLIELANREINREQSAENQARWFAIWVDCEAKQAIPAVKRWLEKLSKDKAKIGAECLVTYLVGERQGRGGTNGMKTYITPRYLKELYILAHSFIKQEDDIDRANGGVYNPGLRDEAQSARSRLFSLLCDLPGKAAYIAIKELVAEHPEPNYRSWMAKQAFRRAESDGNIEPWNDAQVIQFEQQQLITPRTHKQLYELGVHSLNNMKIWLEQGNDSPWKTWQRAEQENEIRNLIAGWLNQNCQDQYTTAQEPELANAQRMDIWLHCNHVDSPVPIELKMLDKSWSGNKLCERLRNQLAGDYLRANGASCGIMVLVSAKTNKTWKIDDQPVPLNQLRGALLSYWNSISKNYPKVNAIEVIVIDLNLRSKVSDT